MSKSTEQMQRQLERQTNDLIGQIHVVETVTQILLRRLLEPQENAAEVLSSIKAETVEMISQTQSLSKDAQDTQRIQGLHSMKAEEFFQPLEEYFQKRH